MLVYISKLKRRMYVTIPVYLKLFKGVQNWVHKKFFSNFRCKYAKLSLKITAFIAYV